jgi:hypothetical protein
MPSRLARVLLSQSEIRKIEEILFEPVNEALGELDQYDPGAFNSRCKDYIIGLKEAFKNDENEDEN